MALSNPTSGHLPGEEARLAATNDLPQRLAAFAERMRGAYDTRPVSKVEWDAASGDEA